MSGGGTDWVSAIAILASGLILGTMFIFFVGRRRAAAAAATNDVDLELRDLEAKRDALIAHIRELDDVSSKLGPAEAAAERTRLELATAEVLRAIDSRKRATAKPRPAASALPAPAVVATPRRNETMIGFLWGAGSMLMLAFLGYLVYRYASPREQGGSVTGGMGQQASQPAQQPPQSDAQTQRLEAAVAQQPDNIDARIDLAREYLEHENMMGVFDQTQYVLTKNPAEPRALTYQALVRMSMGQGTEAAEMLERATKINPSLLDAWVALAWIRTQEGNTKAADAAIASAIKQHPEEKARLEEVIKQMRERPPEPQVAQGGEAGGLPPGHPPITPDSPRVGPVSATAGQTAAPPSGAGVRVLIEGPAKSGTLFLYARAEGVMAGPPVAVRRMNVSTFPVTVDLSSADSMMGQPLPPKMRLEARLDSDGNAMTKDPNDPHAVLDGVAAGSSITLALK